MSEKIAATCPQCGRSDQFDRMPDDPSSATKLTLICPNCDDGGFHSPTYFDDEGREIDWETNAPFDNSSTTVKGDQDDGCAHEAYETDSAGQPVRCADCPSTTVKGA